MSQVISREINLNVQQSGRQQNLNFDDPQSQIGNNPQPSSINEADIKLIHTIPLILLNIELQAILLFFCFCYYFQYSLHLLFIHIVILEIIKFMCYQKQSINPKYITIDTVQSVLLLLFKISIWISFEYTQIPLIVCSIIHFLINFLIFIIKVVIKFKDSTFFAINLLYQSVITLLSLQFLLLFLKKEEYIDYSLRQILLILWTLQTLCFIISIVTIAFIIEQIYYFCKEKSRKEICYGYVWQFMSLLPLGLGATLILIVILDSFEDIENKKYLIIIIYIYFIYIVIYIVSTYMMRASIVQYYLISFIFFRYYIQIVEIKFNKILFKKNIYQSRIFQQNLNQRQIIFQYPINQDFQHQPNQRSQNYKDETIYRPKFQKLKKFFYLEQISSNYFSHSKTQSDGVQKKKDNKFYTINNENKQNCNIIPQFPLMKAKKSEIIIQTNKNIFLEDNSYLQSSKKQISINVHEEDKLEEKEIEVSFSDNRFKPDNTCIICYSKPFDVVYQPCFHGGLCYQCSTQIFQKNKSFNCYLCRCKVLYMLQIKHTEYNKILVIGKATLCI